MPASKYFLNYYFLFDVSEEIGLGQIESLFKAKKISAEEFPYRRSTPEYIKYAVPPLAIKLGNRKMELEGKQLDFEFRAKIFDFGVVSIKAMATIEASLEELNVLSAKLFSQDGLEKKAIALLEELLKRIQPAIISQRNPTEFSEKYLIINSVVEQNLDAQKFLQQNSKTIAKILSLETTELSEQQCNANLENKISYYASDLAIIDFNASFVLDVHEPKDILDVLELARIQLLELRYFDARLDKELYSLYDQVEKIREKDYGKILKKTSELKLNVNELVDKIENAMKLFGETYLVKLYNLAIKEFNIPQWKHSVEEKTLTVEDIYSKVNDRQQQRLTLRLEVLVAVMEVLFIILWVYELFFRA